MKTILLVVDSQKNLPAGVYTCMNGIVFASDSVRKDVAEGWSSSFFTKESFL